MAIKDWIRKWLDISPAENVISDVKIIESSTKELDVLKNKIWYRGDPVELEQFFKMSSLTSTAYSRFWSAAPNNVLVRKMHSGLPKMVVDKLAGIVTEDMNDPDMETAVLSRWEEFCEDVKFDKLLKKAVTDTLVCGDGAFKVCIDPSVSDKPLLEYYSGNNVDFHTKRGKLQKILFYTDYMDDKGKKFKLIETYGIGYVGYELVDELGASYPLDHLEETQDLVDVTFTGDYILGVPMMFSESSKWSGRGDSIFEGKSEMFDALDESISTWIDSLRASRVKQYIPEILLPRDPDTGRVLTPDVFNPYVAVGTSLAEEAKNEIQVKQGEINYDGLLATYTTMLDCALQGLISPSTLGIDVKKLDNAESQREKEKTTMYTRDNLIGVLADTLPKVLDIVMKTWDNMLGQSPKDYEATFTWGQYANPSFEAIVETVGKAKQYGIMSVEKCIDEMYGDSMEQEEKDKELARLQSESMMAEEPGVNDDLFSEV